MEEEKREEKVEELKDDFEEIKEMQKTQELKKIQEDKIVEDNKVEEKEKKCHPMFVTFLIIILMIAFTGMGFFGGVYYYKNSLNKKSDEVEKSDKKDEDSSNIEDKVEYLDVLSEEVVELLAKIVRSSGCKNYYGFFTDKKIAPNDLKNEDRASIVFGNLKVNSKNSYTKMEVEEMYKKLFGNDVTISHSLDDELFYQCPKYEYDSIKEIYSKTEIGCGCESGPGHYTSAQISKAIKTNNGYELDVRVLFGDGGECYADYARTKELYSINDQIPQDGYKDGSLYKVVYTLEDGNYVLSYVEPK